MKICTSLLCFLLVVPLAIMHEFKPLHDPDTVVVTGVSLFDADLHRMRRSMTVVIQRDRIAAVGPDGETRVPPGARRIDGRGKTLLPGFVRAPALEQDLLPLAELGPVELARFIAVQRGWQIAIAPRLVALEQELVEEQHDPASFDRVLALVRKLRHAGVPVVVRTDASLRELELYEKAGLSRLDILYDATLGAARLIHRDDQRGSIQPGKLADLLLIDGAPDRQMADIHRITLAIRHGVVEESPVGGSG